MKAILALAFCFAALMSQVQSQNPTPFPIPGLNLDTIQGLWYITSIYEAGANNSQANPITCYTWDITVSGNDVNVARSLFYNQNQINSTASYTVGTKPSNWIDASDSSSELDWLAIDPLTFSYALLGSNDQQNALFISRSPTISNLIQASLTLVLEKEGYEINSDNILGFDDTCNL